MIFDKSKTIVAKLFAMEIQQRDEPPKTVMSATATFLNKSAVVSNINFDNKFYINF